MGSNNSKEQGKEHPVRRPQNLGSAYGYKNLIFEGGGAKASAYAGAVQVLEELKILQQIERVGGASGGALSALLVAVGMTAEEFTRLTLDTDYEKHLFDGHFGDLKNGNLGALFCSMCNISDCNMYSLFHNYGFFPGQGLLEFLRSLMKEWTGNPDITFMQLYRKYGRELCVIVSDVTTANPDYLHPKTTPDMPVAKAVHISMSLPFIMANTKIKMRDNREHTFVDGGVFLNYPLHVFDGWFLSMKPEDSFFARWDENVRKANGNLRPATLLSQQSLQNPEPNMETLGFRVFTGNSAERDISESWLEMNFKLNKAIKALDLPTPQTRLGRAYLKDQVQNELAIGEGYRQMKGDLQALTLCQGKDGNIHRVDVSRRAPQLLKLFDAISEAKSGHGDASSAVGCPTYITFYDFSSYLETKGFPLLSLFRGNGYQELKGFNGYVNDGIISSVQSIAERFASGPMDIQRTVPLDVRYITTTDFQLEEGDKDFIFSVGHKYTETWLELWKKQNGKILLSNNTPKKFI
eukprot:PhM_4_TR3465/c1_g1_i1/m.25491